MTNGQIEALKQFVRHVIKGECWAYELDGGDLQDKAVQLGILAPFEITQKHLDDCMFGGEGDFEVGDTAYEFTDWLQVTVSDKLEKFRAHRNEGWTEVDGYAVAHDKFRDFKFFLYRDACYWHVCETDAGLSFGGLNKSREKALEGFRERCLELTPEKLAEVVEKGKAMYPQPAAESRGDGD